MPREEAMNDAPVTPARCLALLSLAVACPLRAAEPLKLPLTFEEPAGVRRTAWPVRFGVPMPQGALPTGTERGLRLLDAAGEPAAMVAKVLARWPDGSAKWVLLDGQVDLAAGERATFTLTTGADGPVLPKRPVRVEQGDGAIVVDTGAVRFRVAARDCRGPVVEAVGGAPWVGQPRGIQRVLDYQAPGPRQNPLRLRGSYKRNEEPGVPTVRLSGAGGQLVSTTVEAATPMRVVIRREGWYGKAMRADARACRYVIRYTAFAGKPLIQVTHTFIFTEDAGGFFLRRLGLRVPFGRAARVRFGGAEESLDGADVALRAGESAALVSIGPAVNHNDVLPQEGKAKDVTFDVITYKSVAGKEAVGRTVAAGRHALGTMTVLSGQGGLTVTLRDFWRQHPNELAWAAGPQGAAEVWLWASHGGKVLDTRNPAYNQRVRGETRLGGISTGFAKTHEVLLHFHRAGDARQAAETAAAFDKPVWPHAAPEWNCRTLAMGHVHPYDPKRFPGLERQIEVLYAWLWRNQRVMHWDGIFDWGGVLIEFDNHGQRYSGGRRGTWVWRDYAGWINEDGQQTHHLFKHYLRTARRQYMRMGEAMVRRITDVCGLHHHNPSVPHSDARVGGGHRHDMTAWHSLNTGYSMATLGAVDFYYLTGDERMRECLELYGRRCDEDGIGPGYGGAHFAASLVRIWEATGEERFKEAAMKKLLAPAVKSGVLKPNFRVPTDLWPHVIFQEQILRHEPTADLLLEAARTVSRSMSEELCAWAYLRTRDAALLDKVKASCARLRNVRPAAELPDPWKMSWPELRSAMDRMPAWYAKVYINSQQVGRYPNLMKALAEGRRRSDAPTSRPDTPAPRE